MIEHMNSDHANAIAHYVALTDLPRTAPAELVGIDSEGMHLRIGQGIHWLAFPRFAIRRYRFAKPWSCWPAPTNGRLRRKSRVEMPSPRIHLVVVMEGFLPPRIL